MSDISSTVTKTTCPYCGVGCGIDVKQLNDARIEVKGDKQHPANYGRLCSKGSALAETIDLEGRLLHPQVDGKQTSWQNAIGAVAKRFSAIIQEHGPDAVAFYVSGQLLTEDYYVANKLIKGYIGTANIDTNSRLCMASSVAGHKRAFGADTVPGNYEDLEQTEMVVLTGSNTAWCHPVLYQRLVKAKKANPDMKVVVIDPRRTATCDIADLHLALKPGSDALLFNGLLNHLYSQGYADNAYIAEHTQGMEEALRMAQWYTPNATTTASHCDLQADKVETFFRWFAHRQKVVSVYSQGINQTSSGTDKVNAIINCHLLTGRIGRPGAGPFSVTGQPNAMGGREVGALANQLASHMDFAPDDVDTVQRFWQAPNIADKPGLKAVDMFRAIEKGEIKALWVMATNPAVSMPNSSQVQRALNKCECLVVSDCIQDTDTTKHADILLPALAWGEKNGTVTNSERRISRQRGFLSAPGEAQADWWILSQVATAIGYSDFNYAHPKDIFNEYAALSGFENNGERDFDISGLNNLSQQHYDKLEPFQWPLSKNQKTSSERLFSNGRFYTENRRARFIAVTPRPPAEPPSSDYPMVLNTGRVRDHWHTMTRTGKSPRLSSHIAESFASLHPADAEKIDIQDGELLQVSSHWGEVIVRAEVSQDQRQGELFIPMHWNDQFASAASVGRVVNPHHDPVSGQPEFKHTPVRLLPYRPKWHGFMLSRHAQDTLEATYWNKVKRKHLWHYELAGEHAPLDWALYARSMLCIADQDAQWTEFFDNAKHSYRAARIVDGKLMSCIFIGPDHNLPRRDWLIQLFEKDALTPQQRTRVLAGEPGPDQEDAGRTICSCFSVGEKTLLKAIKNGAATPEQLGEELQAGTNCGSCVPELRTLISQNIDSK